MFLYRQFGRIRTITHTHTLPASFKNIVMKSIEKLKETYHTNYNDKSEFASKARLLQSIWRVEKGYDYDKKKNYGNFLDENFARLSGANFLTKNIFEIVKKEVENKHIQKKVIQEPRIWNNLLSSQPLAFNLFGELKKDYDLASKVFQELFPERNIKNVTAIEFEYSPGRRNPKYTGDSSAFDVFIKYKTIDNKKGFFGIEVKYAEDLNDEPSTHKKTYETISDKSDIFNLSKLNELKNKPIQQIWRDHLLALSLFITNNDFDIGDFIYIHQKIKNCEEAIKKYIQTFNFSKDTHFKPLTLEIITNKIKEHTKNSWIDNFEDRYLKFEKIDEACRQQRL